MAYTLTYNTTTAITTPVINSTKVVIFANVACYSNINGTATSSSTYPIIEPNTNAGLGQHLEPVALGRSSSWYHHHTSG